jgi:exonuclease SbcD
MRILHTGDWHLGKVLKGVDRLPEQRAVMAEIVEIATAEAAELVVVAGDVFDSAAPAPDAQRLAWETLLALRGVAAVLVVAGNHDNAEAFEAVRPVFGAVGVTVVGKPVPPEAGGVVTVTGERSGDVAQVAMLPFVSQRGVVRAGDLFALDAPAANARYAERVARLVARLSGGFTPATVNVLVVHGTVTGARFGGGEREAQSLFDYHLSTEIFPGTASYVALGHLHRTQLIEARSPVWYAGAPIAVDFGEQESRPGVLLVEAEPGAPARVRTVELRSPRRLRTLTGTVAEMAATAGTTGDDLLRVVVAEPARAGLAEEVRTLLPNAIDVTLATPAGSGTAPPPSRAGRSGVELFHSYLGERGVEDARLEALFAELYDAAVGGER